MNSSLYDALLAYVHDSEVPEMNYAYVASSSLAVLAARVLGHASNKYAQFDLLKPLLNWVPEPDPLAEPLLELGEKLALEGLLEEEGSSDMLGEAFRRKREAYRLQFASVYALEAMGDAVTDYLLAKTAAMQPFANSGKEDVFSCKVMKLKDIEAARFESYEAQLFDLSEEGLTYHELMLEFDTDALGLLQSLEPLALSLRFVFDLSFIELSSHNGGLFDIEVNLGEKRLYTKLLLEQRPPWENLESIVIREDSKP